MGGVMASSFLVGLGKSQTDIPMARTSEKIKKYLSAGLKNEFKILPSQRNHKKIVRMQYARK
jgi:hypothetical protein